MQRLILAVASAALLASCAATRLEVDKVSTQESAVMVSFAKYEQQGFTFSPDRYEGVHKLIGVISVSTVPGARFISFQDDPNDPNTPITKFEWHRDAYSVDRVIDSIFKWSKQNGANAISEFRIVTRSTSLVTGLPLIEISVSGLAIRRE